MIDQSVALKVLCGSNRLRPRAFRWGGRTIRVLAVESIKTFGTELRYRVLTGEGNFELGLFSDTGTWWLRRAPNWLSRWWVRWQTAPRYPLPFWRRRIRRTSAKRSALASNSWLDAPQIVTSPLRP